MLNNLAQVYAAEKRYADAGKVFARAIGIWERTLGPAHPDLAGCLLNYAAVLRKLHRAKEASQVEARAKQVKEAHQREETASTLVDWHELQRH